MIFLLSPTSCRTTSHQLFCFPTLSRSRCLDSWLAAEYTAYLSVLRTTCLGWKFSTRTGIARTSRRPMGPKDHGVGTGPSLLYFTQPPEAFRAVSVFFQKKVPSPPTSHMDVSYSMGRRRNSILFNISFRLKSSALNRFILSAEQRILPSPR
jgi:hypothetical protein